jgi:antitoxin component YwqK of YwqJK toxin-antitoxin module
MKDKGITYYKNGNIKKEIYYKNSMVHREDGPRRY